MVSVNKKQANADDPMLITSISHTFVISNEALEHILNRTIVANVGTFVESKTKPIFIEKSSFFRRRS